MSNEGSVAMPLDKFAHDFLLYLNDLFYVQQGTELGRIPNTKVLLCNDQCWKQLYPTFRKTVRGSPAEYADLVTAKDWPRVGGQSLMVVEMDKQTGAVQLAEEEARKGLLKQSGFPRQIVSRLAARDALIFLHASYIDDRKAFVNRDKYSPELAETLVEHSIVAHESTHIAYNLAGRHMERWDPNVYSESPEVIHLFTAFVNTLGKGKFSDLYIGPKLADALVL
jgi:hypothetical protein